MVLLSVLSYGFEQSSKSKITQALWIWKPGQALAAKERFQTNADLMALSVN